MTTTPPPSMIEKMAEAIVEAIGGIGDGRYYLNDDEGLAAARAALAELLMPTPAMMAKTLPVLRNPPKTADDFVLIGTALSMIEPELISENEHMQGFHVAEDLLADWREMLNAALEGK